MATHTIVLPPTPPRFFFQADDGIRDHCVTGVQTCALPISSNNYFIDGLYNNDRYYGDSAINQTGILGIPAVTFPPEAIEELSVQETPSAEFGVKGGDRKSVVEGKSGDRGGRRRVDKKEARR